MKTKLNYAGDTIAVETQSHKDTWTIRLHDEAHTLTLVAQHDNELTARLSDGTVLRALVTWTGNQCELVMNGQRHVLQAVRASAAGAQHASGGHIVSPLPGRVVDVAVGVGDAVSAGQAVCIIEAMKMQNEICAPRSGTVETIHCAAGDNVDGGHLLVVLAEA